MALHHSETFEFFLPILLQSHMQRLLCGLVRQEFIAFESTPQEKTGMTPSQKIIPAEPERSNK